MQLEDLNLSAKDIMEMADKYMIGAYPRFPFVAVRAKDQYVYDQDGNAWLDFFGGIAVNSCGNCNEKVTKAICEQAQELVHTANYPYTIPQAVLAKRICDAIGMDQIFYQNSGTEANEAMIKMVRKFGIDNYSPDRFHIITAQNSFHGRTYGALSATYQPESSLHTGFKPLLEGFDYAEFNNLESFKAAITPQTIGIMIEPVQGESGVYPATPEFLKGLRQLCDSKGLILMFDEVQTGWGRTGSLMAYMGYGIKPDVVSMAKAMGNGIPIGAICANKNLASAFTPGAHGTTFGGNVLSCAAAYAAIGEIIDRDLSANAAKMGKYFMDILRSIPHVKEVRGKGLIIGIEFDAPVGINIKHGCLDRHMLVNLIGQSIIRLVPPLIINESDCDKAYDILKAAAAEAYEIE